MISYLTPGRVLGLALLGLALLAPPSHGQDLTALLADYMVHEFEYRFEVAQKPPALQAFFDNLRHRFYAPLAGHTYTCSCNGTGSNDMSPVEE